MTDQANPSKTKLTIVIGDTFEYDPAIHAALAELLTGASFVFETANRAADDEDVLMGVSVSDGVITFNHGGYGADETVRIDDIATITVF